jgi:glutamate carboxypeptidase
MSDSIGWNPSVFDGRLESMLADLQAMVEMESPTHNKDPLDRLGAWIAERMEALGFATTRYPEPKAGDHWLAETGSGGGGILLLHHMDTVYPEGTIASMPWSVREGRAYGPGVLDMKGGIVVTFGALSALRDTQPGKPIRCLFTSDEETGSRTSRPLVESLAREANLVLCLEPSLPGGGLKTQRKGTGLFFVEVHGRAAHAGNDPEAGVNAIAEMALQIPAIHALAAPSSGTTVSVGVIQGGTRSNVVPEHCRVKIDVRIADAAEKARVEEGFASLRPHLPGARLEVRGGWSRPPMARTRAIAGAFERARRIADGIGLTLSEGGAGGGSDANFVAALEVPVLDGLGPIGDHAHSPDEYLEIASLPPRAALLAALLREW